MEILLTKGGSSMHNEIGKAVFKNMKLEAAIIVITIICAIADIKRIIPTELCNKWSTYFCQDRIINLSNFFSITVGIYLAIITLLATSVIGISKEILKKRADIQLISVLVFGMAENILAVFLSIFADSNFIPHYTLFLCAAILTSLISFIKFIILIILIFIANMDRTAKMIDEEDEYKENLQSLLEDIVRNTNNLNPKP